MSEFYNSSPVPSPLIHEPYPTINREKHRASKEAVGDICRLITDITADSSERLTNRRKSLYLSGRAIAATADKDIHEALQRVAHTNADGMTGGVHFTLSAYAIDPRHVATRYLPKELTTRVAGVHVQAFEDRADDKHGTTSSDYLVVEDPEGGFSLREYFYYPDGSEKGFRDLSEEEAAQLHMTLAAIAPLE